MNSSCAKTTKQSTLALTVAATGVTPWIRGTVAPSTRGEEHDGGDEDGRGRLHVDSFPERAAERTIL